MTARDAQAGITLIEMLVALAVSSAIGIASFTLLDGVTTRDAQLKGRLDRILDRDRAFRLVAMDAGSAITAAFDDAGGLRIETAEHTVTWIGGASGLQRRIERKDGRVLTQVLAREAAVVGRHGASSRGVFVEFTSQEFRKLIDILGLQ
ncbi:MAG: prepilin-type N-terminal cleavage/methylation domain-containing protein [Pseudomonadota bacterium]